MSRQTKHTDGRKSAEQEVNENAGSQGVTSEPVVGSHERGTPIETYKGDPSSRRSKDVGDLEEETLDSNAPFNKTYGIKNGSHH